MQKAVQLQGGFPPTPWPGALPLDLTGGSALRPHYRFALRPYHVPPPKKKTGPGYTRCSSISSSGQTNRRALCHETENVLLPIIYYKYVLSSKKHGQPNFRPAGWASRLRRICHCFYGRILLIPCNIGQGYFNCTV